MNSKTINTQYKYFGMWPVSPTPFHENGEVDFDGMERVLGRDPIKPLDIDTKNLLINFAKKYDLLTFKWGK